MVIKQITVILTTLLIILCEALLMYFLGFSIKIVLMIAGLLFLLSSFIVSRLAPSMDTNDRVIGYDDFYIPSMWSINGFMIGTRLIKSKSNPFCLYSFFSSWAFLYCL